MVWVGRDGSIESGVYQAAEVGDEDCARLLVAIRDMLVTFEAHARTAMAAPDFDDEEDDDLGSLTTMLDVCAEARPGDDALTSTGYGPLMAPESQLRPLEDLVQAAIADLKQRLSD